LISSTRVRAHLRVAHRRGGPDWCRRRQRGEAHRDPWSPAMAAYGAGSATVIRRPASTGLIGFIRPPARAATSRKPVAPTGLKESTITGGEWRSTTARFRNIEPSKIFELSDFRINPLRPPDWLRPLTPAELKSRNSTPSGNRNATLLGSAAPVLPGAGNGGISTSCPGQ
jgi:hypothetical protein